MFKAKSIIWSLIVIGVVFMINVNLSYSFDTQDAWDNTFWIRENFPESTYVQDAVIFGASPYVNGSRYGATHQIVNRVNLTDIKMIYFHRSSDAKITSTSEFIDSIRLIDGSLITFDHSSRDITFDSAFTAYIAELSSNGPVSLEMRIADAELTEIYDFYGQPTLCEFEHFTLYFTPTDLATVDSVKQGLANVLPPDCYVMEKGIPIDFDLLPPESCTVNFYDELTDEQWYLLGGAGINAFAAWETACHFLHNDVTVVIHDSGHGNDPSFHPDFRDNINFEKTRINWAYERTGVHGTLVAGIAAAAEGNHPPSREIAKASGNPGIGIVGVAPKSKLVLVDRQDDTDAITDLRYAIDSCGEVAVVNFSWGMFFPDPAMLDLIMVGYFNKNISFVAAGGNCTFMTPCPFYVWPQAFGHNFGDEVFMRDLVIAVAGHTIFGRKWIYSNYGEFIDLSAPSANILTTDIDSYMPYQYDNEFSWRAVSGTSVAAPMVTGAVAIMKSVMNIPNETVFELLKETADPYDGDPAEWNENRGYGGLNMGAAVAAMMNRFCDTIPGDVNGDAFVNYGDARYLFRFLYTNGPEPPVPDSIADANGDCIINLLDITYIINYVFLGGPAPIGGCSNTKNPNFVTSNDRQIPLRVYPNPFNPITRFSFSIPERTHVNITIYNIAGQRVAELIDKDCPAGEHEITWNGLDINGLAISTGIYFARFQAGEFTQTRKIIMMK